MTHRLLFCACLLLGSLRADWAPAVHRLEDLRVSVDAQPAVRQSYGVRRASAEDPTAIVVDLGASVTELAENPESYRIVSFEDQRYAPERFVRPLKAVLQRELECAGVEGSALTGFQRTRVTLQVPEPLLAGRRYHLVAQGAGQVMVTAARAAAPFVAGQPPVARDPDLDLAVIGLRRIVSIGNGVLMLDLGPGFAAGRVKTPSVFEVRVNGTPVVPTAMGRRSLVDAYLPAGWPFTALPCHEWFLQLPTSLQDGDQVSVRIDAAFCAGLCTGELSFQSALTHSPSLKVNQVGYLTGATEKVAYLGRWLGEFPMAAQAARVASDDAAALFHAALLDKPVEQNVSGGPALWFAEPPRFRLHREEDGAVVHEGTARLVHRSGQLTEGVHAVDHSGENVYELDFGAYRESGRYFLSVAGLGRSPGFGLSDTLYERVFRAQATGVFLQRCGQELGAPHSPWHRIACHADGLIPTTLTIHTPERDLHHSLPGHVDYSGQASFVPPPALRTLNQDPALLGHWPMDGDLQDRSRHRRTLVPLDPSSKSSFVDAPALMAPHNRAFGPTDLVATNGFRIPGPAPAIEDGVSFTMWLRFPGEIKFSGVLIGHQETNTHVSRLQVTAGWGFLRAVAGGGGETLDIGRLSSGNWHHLAVVVDPLERSPRRLSLFVDGLRKASVAAGNMPYADRPFVLAALEGEGAAGKYLDDVRIYGRALEDEEVRTLARRWGEAAISIPARGGHHDAGDYNPRSHLEVARILMNAYEMAPDGFRDGQLNLPEAGNGIPDILDEAAWAMRLWLSLQREDGAVRGGTESNGDPNFIQTVELDTLGDYALAVDAMSSYWFAGTFAQAARVWGALGHKDQAAGFLQRAQKAYAWAEANPDPASDDPGTFARRRISPRAYAAAQLLHSTGDRRYHQHFEEASVWSHKPDAELEVHRLYDQQEAAWAYLQCPAELCDPDLRANIRNAVIQRADLFIQHCDTMAYKFYRHPWAPITWGTGAYPNQVDPLLQAWVLTGEPRYHRWLIRTCDFMLGANPLSRSWVTGLGARPIHAPLHNSRYSHAGEVAPGLHAQGPNQRGEGYRIQETAHPRLREDFALLYTYADVHFAIPMNEGTIPSLARSMALFGVLNALNPSPQN